MSSSSRNARNRQKKRKSEEEFRRRMEEQEREERMERLERLERIQRQIKFEKLEKERKARFERFERIMKREDERRMREQEKQMKENEKHEGLLEDQEDGTEARGKREGEQSLDKQDGKLGEARSLMKRKMGGKKWYKKIAAYTFFGLFGIWLLVFCGCFLYDAIKYNNFGGRPQFFTGRYEETTYGKGLKFIGKYFDEFGGQPIAEFYDNFVKRFDASIFKPFRQYFDIPDGVNAWIYLLDLGGEKFCRTLNEVVFPVVKYSARVIRNIITFILDAGYILIFDVVVPWLMED